MVQNGKEIEKQFYRQVQHLLKEHNLFPEGARILIGCSGGADSMALVVALQAVALHLHRNWHVGVVTINHQIRSVGSDELNGVKAYMEERSIPFYGISIDIPTMAKNRGESLETMGRRMRYETFYNVAKREGYHYIAVGHHKDDQGETILGHLIRGTGLAGLRGMQVVTTYDGETIPIIRPLLGVTKSDIYDYIQSQSIPYYEDESNRDTTYKRNKIRHHLIPLLQDMNPNIVDTLTRLGVQATADEDYIIQCSHDVYKKIVTEYVDDLDTKYLGDLDLVSRLVLIGTINRRELRKLHSALQYRIWRAIGEYINRSFHNIQHSIKKDESFYGETNEISISFTAKHMGNIDNIVKSEESKKFVLGPLHIVGQYDTIGLYCKIDELKKDFHG